MFLKFNGSWWTIVSIAYTSLVLWKSLGDTSFEFESAGEIGLVLNYYSVLTSNGSSIGFKSFTAFIFSNAFEEAVSLSKTEPAYWLAFFDTFGVYRP